MKQESYKAILSACRARGPKSIRYGSFGVGEHNGTYQTISPYVCAIGAFVIDKPMIDYSILATAAVALGETRDSLIAFIQGFDGRPFIDLEDSESFAMGRHLAVQLAAEGVVA